MNSLTGSVVAGIAYPTAVTHPLAGMSSPNNKELALVMSDFRPDTVRAVIVDGDRVMMVQTRQLKPENVGKWCLPGGKIEAADASLPAALRRELFEELGVEVAVHEKIDLWEEPRDGYIRLHHIYRVTLPHTGLTIDPVEIHSLDWFTLAEAEAVPCKLGLETRAISRVLAHRRAGRFALRRRSVS